METVLNNPIKNPQVFKYLVTFNAVSGFSYGLMTSLLTLFVMQTFKVKSNDVVQLSSAFYGLLYIMPILMGYLAGAFGYIKAVIIGCILSVVSYILLLSPVREIAYLGIGGTALSTSLYYTAYLVILGRHYSRNDIRRDSAFTISYMMMNIGIFLGAICGGYLTQAVSYHASFVLGAIISAIFLTIFLFVIAKLEYAKDRELDNNLPFSPLIGSGLFIIAIVVLTYLCGWLLNHSNLTNYLLIIFVSVVSITMLAYAVKQSKEARNKIFAFFILGFIAMGFYICFSLEPSLITLFVDSNVQLYIFGGHIPASNIFGMESLFVVLLAYPIARMWIVLARMNKEPSLPAKFSLALLVMGGGYLVLALSALMNTNSQLINLGWVVISYLMLSGAELMLMPVGNAMVGRIAPQRLEGLFMGTWQSFQGVSAAIAGVMIGLIILPKPHAPIDISNPIYEHSFFGIGLATVALGVLALLLVPLINKVLKAK